MLNTFSLNSGTILPLAKVPRSPPSTLLGPTDLSFANSMNLFLRDVPFNAFKSFTISSASDCSFTKIWRA